MTAAGVELLKAQRQLQNYTNRAHKLIVFFRQTVYAGKTVWARVVLGICRGFLLQWVDNEWKVKLRLRNSEQ